MITVSTDGLPLIVKVVARLWHRMRLGFAVAMQLILAKALPG